MEGGSNMPQLVNLFLVIFGVIAVGAGLAGLRSHPASWLVLIVGIAVIALAYFSDRRRERRRDERKRADEQRRLDELTRRSWGPGDSLRVPGSVWAVPASLLLAAVGAGIWHMGVATVRQDWIPLLAGAFFLAFGGLLLARALPGIGRPALELTSAGFATPLNGRIAWRDVSGVFLQAVTHRNGVESFRLMFRVKQFARVAPAIHWTDRLFAMFRLGALARGVVSVGLPTSKEPPKVVYALARQLWKQATGHDHDWNPLMSDQYNEAMQRMDAVTTRMRASGAVEASLADPERLSRDMAQLEQDMALITGERRRELAKAQWVTGVVVVLMLLVVAWPWVGKLLRP
jgi:membrane protein implicated in regulation of membrane protease activity